MNQTPLSNDIVVLVHGLGGSRLDMWPLARQLRRRGYAVRNWGYRSVGQRIETHAARLA
jgi:esterase/lipase